MEDIKRVKRKPGRPKGSRTNKDRPHKVTSDGRQVVVPPVLSRQATQDEIITHIQQSDKVVLLLHNSLARYRDMFQAVKRKKEVHLNAVSALAAVGHDKRQLARALGFDDALFRERPDLQAAYDEGRSALEGALLTKQIEMALQGNEKLIVHLGKVLMGQTEGPTTALQVNVTNDGKTSTVSIKDKIADARQKALLAKETFSQTVEAVDAEFVEPAEGTDG